MHINICGPPSAPLDYSSLKACGCSPRWLECICTPGTRRCNKIRTSTVRDLNKKWLDYWFWLFGSPAPRWFCGGRNHRGWHLALCLPLAVSIDCRPYTSRRSALCHPFLCHLGKIDGCRLIIVCRCGKKNNHGASQSRGGLVLRAPAGYHWKRYWRLGVND